MAIAYDATSEVGGFATPDPLTVTHTPSGTPRAVVVYLFHGTGTEAFDEATGPTYGATAMSKIAAVNEPGAGEAGSVSAWFLGASVPTGAQTVSWNHAGGTGRKYMVTITYTAAGDCSVSAYGTLSGSQANPQIAINSGAATAARSCGIFSGLAAPTDLTLLSNQSAVHDDDVGNYIFRVDRETSTSTGSFTTGYTAASDEVAMVAVGIQETSTISASDLAWYYSETTGPGNSNAGTAAGSLGGFCSTTKITTATDNNLLDDVSASDNAAQEDNYGCMFYRSDASSGIAQDVYVWLVSQTGNADVWIGIDPAGVTAIGSATAQAATIANEATAPSGVTFYQPTSKTHPDVLGPFTLDPSECQAIWVKRTTLGAGSGVDAVLIRAEGAPA